MSIPVISFVAMSSGSGKTTLLEKVIPILKAKGLRLAIIKHDAHSFEMDRPGKDTWRFANAGADIVAISSAEKFALIERLETEHSLDDIISKISNVDLIITEGFKRENKPKVLVVRHEGRLDQPEEEIVEINRNELLAVAGDGSAESGVPFYSLEDIEGITKEIMRYIHR
ncbi:MAG: molybdopterin-guanine dinucleotide biosynthesis protein B [Clostridiales bacterium]|nr:molybdopterin-guanine dinucleotide biosynthesis protein B [Clostridiales bacterium]